MTDATATADVVRATISESAATLRLNDAREKIVSRDPHRSSSAKTR